MCNYPLMSYFGGPCVSDQTGLSRGLRIHFVYNNHVNIAILYVGQINEHSDSDYNSDSDERVFDTEFPNMTGCVRRHAVRRHPRRKFPC